MTINAPKQVAAKMDVMKMRIAGTGAVIAKVERSLDLDAAFNCQLASDEAPTFIVFISAS